MALDFQPDLAKIVELLLYLAHRKPGADKYQAVKFFYLADREHLLRHGRPITSEKYYALTYGPVASNAKDLLEENPFTLKRAGIKSLPFDVKKVASRSPDKAPLIVIGAPHREVDTDLFSKSDIRVFDEILAKYGSYDFDSLFKVTHNHDAYRKAWARRGMSNRSEMVYDEMIEAQDRLSAVTADIGPFARYL